MLLALATTSPALVVVGFLLVGLWALRARRLHPLPEAKRRSVGIGNILSGSSPGCAPRTSENPLKPKFAEHGLAPFRWTSSGRPDDRDHFPGFSGSSAVASRNGLQRFLAAYVATWGGHRRRSEESGQNAHPAECWSAEIATANFGESFLCDVFWGLLEGSLAVLGTWGIACVMRPSRDRSRAPKRACAD